MGGPDEQRRFANLGFEDFRRLAADPALSRYEKIGFPDSYRAGKEEAIHADLLAKLPPLSAAGATVLDVGPGCSDLPRMLIAHASERGQALHLVDSAEMLGQLPDSPNVVKTAAFFPECPELLSALHERVDAAIVYSVLHYLFVDTNVWKFLDATLALLAPGGHLLIGDIPNASMRKRFLASHAGRQFHRSWSGRDEDPSVSHNVIEPGSIDDSVVVSLMLRARAAGFHAYVLPQPASLPMHNRREDLLIVRP
jgi:hypothetical protein